MIPGLELKVRFDEPDATPALLPALIYVGVRAVARLLTTLAPLSAAMALLTSAVWIVVAFFLFAVLAWWREDNWLGAGIIFASTVLCGGLIAELMGRVLLPGPLVEAVIAMGNASMWMAFRAIILVPLAGGAVAGARWLTHEGRQSGAWSS
jgi:hypothetical protein